MAFKRSQLPHRSHESKGKMDSQVYTLPSPWFYCTQRIPGRHTHRAEESEETLKTWEVLILNHWVAAGCLGVIVTQAGSSTHDLLFPLAGERLSWTFDLFLTWVPPLGFCSWTQRGFKLPSSSDGIMRTGNCPSKPLPTPSGIPVLLSKIMSHLVRSTSLD